MRRFSLMFLAAALVLALAPAASAQPAGLYFTPKIGYSHLKTDLSGSVNWDIGGFIGSEGMDKESHSKGQAVLGLAVGYDFKPAHDIPLRAEFEYAWRGKKEMFSRTDSDDDFLGSGQTADISQRLKVGVQSFFLNAYFDIHNSSPVTPYIGAGLGLARVSGAYRLGLDVPAAVITEEGDIINKTKTNFAWNIGAGAAFQITDLVSLDLGYRYADFGKVNGSATINQGADFITLNAEAKAKAHEVMLGLRFTF